MSNKPPLLGYEQSARMTSEEMTAHYRKYAPQDPHAAMLYHNEIAAHHLEMSAYHLDRAIRAQRRALIAFVMAIAMLVLAIALSVLL